MTVTASTSSRLDCSVGETVKYANMHKENKSQVKRQFCAVTQLEQLEQEPWLAELLTSSSCNDKGRPHTLWPYSPSITLPRIRLHTEANAVHLPEGVGHARLVAKEGSEVNRLAGVVFGPGTHPPPVLLTAPVWQEAHVPMAGRMEFAMGLGKTKTQRQKLETHTSLC